MKSQVDFNSLYKELEQLEIEVDEFSFISCNALTIKVDNKYHIGINKDRNFSEYVKFWLIEHELEHIKNDTFYHMHDDKYIINKNERITNDAVITKLGIVSPVLMALIQGYEKWEICENMELPYEVYDCVIDYINRRGLSKMKNCVELLCIKKGYDADVLALKLGCTKTEAQNIIDEKVVIKYEQIRRLCQIFEVEQEYLLCIGNNA